MCKTCGCGEEAESKVVNLQTGAEFDLKNARADGGHAHPHPHGGAQAHAHPHAHERGHHHDHDHGHDHAHDHAHDGAEKTLDLQTRILAKNDALAARNRAWLAGREIFAVNLVSSPGAGKTTLVERTILALKEKIPIFVIEGDQATSLDGERIRAAGAPAVQVNTGAGCHLDAEMVARGLMELRPSPGSIVLIENVGNLVCPALFDLGEGAKAVVLSVTEGDDKPLKYPHMFRAAQLVAVNKIDLAPYVDFDRNRALENARRINPGIEALQISATTGEGLEAWLDWLLQAAADMRDDAFALSEGAGPSMGTRPT
jgi:hydrogenase nickel incorporation protein HypB